MKNGQVFDGNKLKELRERKFWTQTDLAQKLGVNKTQVCRWEQGVVPHARHLESICNLFHISRKRFFVAAPAEAVNDGN